MSHPRIVTPGEAQVHLASYRDEPEPGEWVGKPWRYAHTVATEPYRTRAAIVKALRKEAEYLNASGHPKAARIVAMRAAAVDDEEDYE